jgi:hypothetical protein
MRKIKITILLLIASLNSNAQYPLDIKSDRVWVLGYDSSSNQNFGNSIISFENLTIDTFYKNGNVDFYLAASSVCDTAGNLLFSSNGFCAYDSALDKIEGTDSMMCCNIIFQGNYNEGATILEGVNIVKAPDKNDKYFIISKPKEQGLPLSLSLRVTTVQQIADTLVGIEKDFIVHSDSLSGIGNIELCRHANGRDWWLVQRHYRLNKYWIYLIDQNGVNLKDSVEFSTYIPEYFTQAVFSTDGSKFVIAGMYNAIGVDSLFIAMFDFDRCVGMLSNPQYYSWKEDYVVSTGCAFSANSKYLYVSSTDSIHQFNISEPDWISTKTLVATWDGFEDTVTGSPWATTFSCMQLAPDNKIYIVDGNTTYLTTIDNPDEVGLACNVNQHSFRLPSKNGRTMPNFPLYRMGPIDGSDCDTLGIDMLSDLSSKLDNNTAQISIFPNPAIDYITLMIPRITKSWEFVIYDIQGKEVFRNKSRGAFRSYDVSFLASGLYVWKVRYEDGRSENGKLVKE